MLLVPMPPTFSFSCCLEPFMKFIGALSDVWVSLTFISKFWTIASANIARVLPRLKSNFPSWMFWHNCWKIYTLRRILKKMLLELSKYKAFKSCLSLKVCLLSLMKSNMSWVIPFLSARSLSISSLEFPPRKNFVHLSFILNGLKLSSIFS